MSGWKTFAGPALSLFANVRGNARIIVITEGISNIAFQWYVTYLPLYFLALGLDEVTIGWLASAMILTQIVSTLMGGAAADRYGRKRVLVIGDILCWGIPLALYGIAQNPWYLVIGRLLNGFINVVFPSFECMFVEDVAEEHRPAVFGTLQFLLAGGSLLAPLAGLLVARLGMVSAGRVIMLSTAGMAVAIAILRQFTLNETSMGRERMSSTAGAGAGKLLSDFSRAMKSIAEDRRVWTFLLLRVIGAVSGVVWGTYAMIYLTAQNGARLPEALIALVPTLSAVVTLVGLFLSAERLASRHLYANLVIGQVLWIGGSLVFLISPLQPVLMAGLWTLLSAASLVLFQPASLSYWANIVDERQRAMVSSTATALIMLSTLPVGPLAGYLYQVSPRIPFIITIVLQALQLLIILVAVQRGEAGKKEQIILDTQ
jgi:MFS transporter, DHA1 family, tetracycline resistance protein